MATTEFALNTLVFTVEDNEFTSAKIQRIVIDSNGTNYVLIIDGAPVEKSTKQIDKTKEGLFNKMVDRFSARQQK